MKVFSNSEGATLSARVPSYVLSELWQEVVVERGTNWGQVVSESMCPVIKKGDRVLVEKVAWDRIRFGDVIVFRKAGNLTVHRVLGKRKIDGGCYLLEKGDAVLWSSLVPVEEVVGRVRSIESSGRITDAVSGYGRFLQMSLACQSYISLHVWRLLAYCLRCLGQTPYRRLYAGSYRKLSTRTQHVILLLAVTWGAVKGGERGKATCIKMEP